MTKPTSEFASRFSNYKLENYFTKMELNFQIDPYLALNDPQLLSNIQKAYERLEKRYYELPAEDQVVFFNYYSSFISLGKALENEKKELTEHQSLTKKKPFNLNLAYELRKLLLEVYGEEYLDDITYRNALISSVRPVLALRKLLSPIKLGAVVLIGLSRLTQRLAVRFLVYLLETIDKTVKDYEEYKIISFSSLLFKIIFFVFVPVIISLCMIFYSFLGFLGFASFAFLWAITPALTVLACPVNQLIRPLADKTQIPAFIIASTCLLTLGTLIFFAMQEALWTASVAFIFYHINILLIFYLFYKLIDVCLHMNQDSIAERLGLVTEVLLVGTVLCLLGYAGIFLTPGILFSQIAEFLCLNIVNVFIFVISPSSMKKDLSFFDEPPHGVLSNETRDSILLANKTAAQSHRFFNTPQDAEVVPAAQRTFLHRASIFFGGHGNIQHANLFSQVPGWENRSFN